MKKILALIMVLVFVMTAVSCGNKRVIDLTYTYDKAIVCLPNGDIVEGEVEDWTDYDDGDQIQVKIDGVIYLVHSSNVVLIKEK